MNVIVDTVKKESGRHRVHLNLSVEEAKHLHYMLVKAFDGLVEDRSFVNSLGVESDSVTSNRIDLNINIRSKLQEGFSLLSRMDGEDYA